ncbi:MAG: hypothetical protein ACNA7R_20700, partial [Natronococcus sp.]
RGTWHSGHDPYENNFALMSIPIGTQALHAAGFAMGARFDDNPVVAWSERDGDSDRYDVFVDRWNGSAWLSLGGSLRGGWGTAFAEGLAIGPGGEIVVAYSVASGEERRVAAARWSAGASTWTTLGTLHAASTSTAWNARVAIDPAGRPLLAWSEPLSDGHGGVAGRYYV